MGDSDTPWEPPLAGTEVEHLIGALDRLRTTFRYKADGLDETGLRTRIGASSLTLGALLKHLAFCEDHASTKRLSGDAFGEPWESQYEGEDWEFTSAADDSADELYALWDGAVARSRATVRGGARGRWPRTTRQHGLAGRPPRQPAAAVVRSRRGVRPPHRPRRPAAGGSGRPGGRGSAPGLEAGLAVDWERTDAGATQPTSLDSSTLGTNEVSSMLTSAPK